MRGVGPLGDLRQVDRGAPKATTVAPVQTLLRRYAAAQNALGNKVSALQAPQDAEAANAELARGEREAARKTSRS